MILDTQILNEEYGTNLTATLADSGLKYEVRNQLVPQLISFERKDPDTEDIAEENVLLLILQGHDVVSWIEGDILIATIKSYADIYPDKKISLLIFAFRKFLRGSNTKLTRVKIETELTRLQIHTKFSHRLIEKPQDLMDTIVHFSKAVAEIPIKYRHYLTLLLGHLTLLSFISGSSRSTSRRTKTITLPTTTRTASRWSTPWDWVVCGSST